MLVGEMMRGLLRGVMNNEKLGESKSLDLRVGQVVRANVLQTFSDNEALLNIDGAKIRARLETPLKAGQSALLQVQPESTSTNILLKPLQITGEVADEAVKDLLKTLSLKETPANRALAQQLLNSPIPLTKENIQQIRQAVAANPPNVPAEEWNQAIVIAHNKGTPITPEAVRALHQVMFGKPMHESIEQLERQLNELVGQKKLTPEAQQRVQQLMQLIQQMKTLSAQLTGQSMLNPSAPGGAQSPSGTVPPPVVPPASATTTSPTVSSNGGAAPVVTGPEVSAPANSGVNSQPTNVSSQGTNAGVSTPAAPTPVPQTQTQTQSQMQTQTTPNNAPRTTSNATSQGAPNVTANPSASANSPASGASAQTAPNLQNTTNAASGMYSPPQTANPAPTGMSPSAPAAGQQATGQASNGQSNPSGAGVPISDARVTAQTARNFIPGGLTVPSPAANAAPVRQVPPSGATPGAASGAYTLEEVTGSEKPVVGQLLKQMGVQTEFALGKAAKQAEGERMVEQARQAMQQALQSNVTAQTAQQQASAQTAFDSVKSALMQLLGMQELPATVKGTLESIVQNITGQQLLLSPDKYGSFSYVTMTIPLFDNQQEGQTAEVHIQSRKGKKGRLDAQNCRLLFDLKMASIGQTMVDVHVVDRIVNIYVMNDHPEVEQLIADSRDEIAQGLERVGYQFLSLKVSSYPHELDELNPAEEADTKAVKMPPQAGQNYRGVDFRV